MCEHRYGLEFTFKWRSEADGAVDQVHEISMSERVMTMRPLLKGEIKPGDTVELNSGGYHLTFMSLKLDDSFNALRFEKAGSLDATFNVSAPGRNRRKRTTLTHYGALTKNPPTHDTFAPRVDHIFLA